MTEIRVPIVLVIDADPIRRSWDDHVLSSAEHNEEPESYEAWEKEYVDGIVEDCVGFARNVRVERPSRCEYRGVEGDRCELEAAHTGRHEWPSLNAALSPPSTLPRDV